MIDLSILPARLPTPKNTYGEVTVVRLGSRHIEALTEACRASADHVKPWLGAGLCPVTPAAVRKFVQDCEQKRHDGYGIVYLLMLDDRCLGMGIINHIHPVHEVANLGYWIRPEACGRNLAVTLCQSLQKLAFSQIQLNRLELFIEPANKASMKVATKLGALSEGLCKKRVFGRDAYLYALTTND